MDAITQYLNDIGRIPRLSEAEHAQLIRRMRVSPPKAAQALRNQIAESHLRLVVGQAKQFTRTGIPLLDLIQEGNIGLLRAVEKFDPDQGIMFSTYATWWIRQRLLRALSEQQEYYTLPPYMADALRRLRKAEETYLTRQGTVATDLELAAALDVPLKDVRALKHLPTFLSLDAPLSDQDGHDMPPDNLFHAALQEDDPTTIPTDVGDLLHRAKLTPKERMVLRLRFGLDDGISRTLKETGQQFNRSPERIRQIEVKAVAKLRQYQTLVQDYLAA